MNKIEAIKATKNGAIAACISAAVTIAVILFAISSDAEGKLALWNDPANYFDVAIILALAFGMYKKSRIASILIFFYFIAAKIVIAIETQSYNGMGISLVFLYFYGKAIQGAFVYHKLEKDEDPSYKATTKWTYIFGIPFVLIVTTLSGFALMSTTGVVPSTRVLSTNEIKIDDIATLKDKGIISSKDTVTYFYSQGHSSILESGNILTQDRVILYLTDEENELQVYEISLHEITDVILEEQGDTINESIYKVSTSDPDIWLKLYLSVEQKGDQKFVKALRDKLPG